MTTVVIVIILVLAFLFYYFFIKLSSLSAPDFVEESVNIPQDEEEEIIIPEIIPTDVIVFAPPEPLPSEQKTGNCFASSVAQPFRQNAWRCTVQNTIYDPCFETADKNFVFCQMNPTSQDSFLIKLTKALPKPEVPKVTQDNWAWYLLLKDGTPCSPFTGTRPSYGTPPNTQVAYYGCTSEDKSQQIVLLGDLTEGEVWKANEAILIRSGAKATGPWIIQSTKEAEIATIWK
jgi:hypothetical protein